MNTNSTDFACLVTGFLTDYLPHHRCYSRNTILSYRDTLKLFLRFLKEEKENILKELFGEIGTKVSVALPFLCDYGRNIHVGNNVSVNMNCTFVDCNKITIGDNVLIASNVQLYTATHPVELAERYVANLETEQLIRCTYALPIKIGNGCWLGGGVIVLPGVTIGDGSVIGAGSVVTKDIPENSLAVGNPCRVIRKINGESI